MKENMKMKKKGRTFFFPVPHPGILAAVAILAFILAVVIL